ncbi:MAG: hypothetical protein WEB03_01240 [Nitriliruptor sp.]|uniref:hypothetical protein n=1 Tax=Nitriliruptor sp. TaxID=2448056 RepID=UPI0034A06C94
MALLSRKPDLPADLHDAWWSFLDCAEVIEGGRRVLLGTLPTGRVEPAPIAVGLDSMRQAIRDAREWMPRWRVDAPADGAAAPGGADPDRVTDLALAWEQADRSLTEAETGCEHVAEVAASTRELEELLTAFQDVIDPLDTFSDAERAWRKAWKVPRERA